MSEFPDSFYRGISNPKDIVNGFLTAACFQFDPYDPSRNDSYCELSINWNDDENALSLLLGQKKAGTNDPQFRGGYCLIDRFAMTTLLQAYIESGIFSYERKPIEEDKELGICNNPYHGNLLIENTTPKPLRKNIQSSLATLAGIQLL